MARMKKLDLQRPEDCEKVWDVLHSLYRFLNAGESIDKSQLDSVCWAIALFAIIICCCFLPVSVIDFITTVNRITSASCSVTDSPGV